MGSLPFSMRKHAFADGGGLSANVFRVSSGKLPRYDTGNLKTRVSAHAGHEGKKRLMSSAKAVTKVPSNERQAGNGHPQNDPMFSE